MSFKDEGKRIQNFSGARKNKYDNKRKSGQRKIILRRGYENILTEKRS